MRAAVLAAAILIVVGYAALTVARNMRPSQPPPPHRPPRIFNEHGPTSGMLTG